MAKSIREQDSLTRELERTRVEKDMMEKVLKAELSDAVTTSIKEKEPGEPVTDPKKHKPRIETTYFI